MNWWRSVLGGIAVALVAIAGAGAASAPAQGDLHFTVANVGVKAARGGAGGNGNLYYHGGLGGVGVETGPAVYVVFWGSQWNNNDPSGEAAYLQSFFGGLYGSQDTWSPSTTQYCQNVPTGTSSCTQVSSAQYVGHPASSPVRGVWFDNSSAAPTRPKQSQLASEAIRAAAHFGNSTASANASVQYVIATAHGNNAIGFGTQYCAWHSSTNSSYGSIAYTNFPYQTDAGAACGQNFVNSGSAGLLDGVSIVSGHEYAETVTDQFPSYGWLDGGGAENGDKCAWIASGQGAAADVTLSTGTFAVQSLWSNNFLNTNGTLGNCAIYYQGQTNQH